MRLQLPLDIGLRDSASYANFIGAGNDEALHALRGTAPQVYLWGDRGCGRTHLLQAACHAASTVGHAAIYVPLAEHARLEPELLEDVEGLELVCVDDLDAVAGRRQWEQVLFTLCDRMAAAGGRTLLSGVAPPRALGLVMPELVTRLGRGLVYQLHLLDDAGRRAALKLRAGRRGFELSDEVLDYVLNRYPRDMHALFALVDRLDHASLAHGRRITVPFLRELEQSPD
jgi:DnaA family protein